MKNYLVTASLILTICISALGQITPSDFETFSFGTGSNPNASAIADFDDDGINDIVVANANSAYVSVYRSSGTDPSLALSAQNNFGVPANPNNVAVGDINNDGLPDIVTSNWPDNSFSVLLNSTSGPGDISFIAAQTTASTPANSVNLTLEDFDTDGLVDVAIAGNTGSTVAIYRNISSGSTASFETQVNVIAGTNVNGIAAGDLDQNGVPDLVVVNAGSNNITIFRNNSTAGSLSFTDITSYATGTDPRSIVIDDFNNDNFPDVAVSVFGADNLRVFTNLSSGAGNFILGTITNYATGIGPGYVASGDLDGDGLIDLITSNNNAGTVSIFQNTSSGTISFGSKADIGSGTNARGSAIGDVNANGVDDIVTTYYGDNSFSVFRNTMSNEFDALMALYNATDGDNWTNNTGWGTDPDLANWHGVGTDGGGNVTSLALFNNNLNGFIPDEITQLTSLEYLEFENNPQLGGNLPANLGNLTNLWGLRIANCAFTGNVPSSLSNLSTLTHLYFMDTQLSGPLPDLSGNTGMTILELRSNNFDGTIGNKLSSMSNLEFITLHTNPNLTGPLPSYFYDGSMPVLDFVRYDGTDICDPDDPAFTSWASSLSTFAGTGETCADSSVKIEGFALNNGSDDTEEFDLYDTGTSASGAPSLFVGAFHLYNNVFRFQLGDDDAVKYGDSDGDNILEISGTDLTVDTEGIYGVEVNSETLDYAVYPINEITLIGSALTGDESGWSFDNEVVMNDLGGGVYEIPHIGLFDGEWKIRINRTWDTFDWGAENSDGTLIPLGGNGSIESGFYNIQVDIINNTYTIGQSGDLLAYYPFDGDLNDYSDNTNIAVLTGGTTTFVEDRFSNATSALHFDGSTYYTTPLLPAENANFSASVWFNWDGPIDGTNFQEFLGWHDGNTKRSYLGITEGDGNVVRWGDSYPNTGVVVPEGQWSHLVAIYDHDNAQGIIYLNGEEVARASVSPYTFTSMSIGSLGPTGGENFVGDMDDIRVFQRALTPNEVNALYSQGGYTQAQVTNFFVSGQVNAMIHHGNRQLFAMMPYGTDLSALSPTVEVNGSASVSPSSGSTQDFTQVVDYTVTSLAGNSTVWPTLIVNQGDIGTFNESKLYGSWTIVNAGGFQRVFPAGDPGQTWWFNPVAPADCEQDDSFTFLDDGSFIIDLQNETVLEPWRGGDWGCGDPAVDATSEFQSLSGGTFSYSLSGSTLSVIGQGAYFGKPNAYNGGAYESEGGPVQSQVDYEVYSYEELDGYAYMTVHISVANGGEWAYQMQRELGSTTDVISFTVPGQIGPAVIDSFAGTIDINVSDDTDVTSLTPTFEVSNGATLRFSNVVQTSGVSSQNFTNPVVYTVVNDDGSTQSWTVTINVVDAVALNASALMALYNSTDGINWIDNTGWGINMTDLSTWYGISTDVNGTVTNIVLDNNGLSGSLPSEIGNLSNLVTLELGQNNVNGSIPPEIGALSNLEWLLLYNNDISGGIPVEIGNLSSLTTFYIQENNNLRGELPPAIGNLSQLQRFQAWNCNLTGTIPGSYGNLSNLISLNIDNNNLSGQIPASLGNLSNLEHLVLYSNDLSGTIPPELGNLSSLITMDFQGNELEGDIPPQLGNLTNLTYLWLDGNHFLGTVPSTFAFLSNLEFLYLNNNQLTELPNFSGADWASTIQAFTVSDNYFTFSDLVPNAGLNAFTYDPQRPLDDERTDFVPRGGSLTLTVSDLHSDNNYQWRRNNVDISGANSDTYTIVDASDSDAGDYTCFVTNNIITDLTLERSIVTVNVYDPAEWVDNPYFEFDGSVEVPMSADANDANNPDAWTTLSEVSIEAWVNISRMPTTGEFMALFTRKISETDPFNAYRMSLQNQFGTPEIGLQVTEGTPGSYHGALFPIDDSYLDRWLHIAGTFDGNVLKFYINGQLMVETYESFEAPTTQSAIDQLIAGEGFFEGYIDDVRLWNHARTQGQIINNAASAVGSTSGGLMGYWPMDDEMSDGNGDVYTSDMTSNGNHLYINTGAFLANFDTVAPEIVVDAPDTYERGTGGVTITATVTDDTEVVRVELYGGQIGGDQVSGPFALTSLGNDEYEITISDNLFDASGVFFSIEAEDIAGNVSYTDYLTIQVTTPAGQQNVGVFTGTTEADYGIFALPYQSARVSDVISELSSYSDNKDKYRLFRYNPASDTYQEYLTNGFNNFDPGRGYWFLSSQQASVTLNTDLTAVETSMDNPFSITLSEGWNLIGNPYPNTINWSEVLAYNGSPNVSLLYAWESGSYQDNRISMLPYRGAFVNNSSGGPLDLDIPVSAMSARAIDAVASGPVTQGIPGMNAWTLDLDVNHNDLSYNVSSLGMDQDASLGIDPTEYTPLPHFSNFVELTFASGRITDWVPVMDQHTWDFSVNSSFVNESMTLDWDPATIGANGYTLILHDLASDQLINMAEETSYAFTQQGETHDFKIYFGRDHEVHNMIQLTTNSVGTPYPNPFNNRIKIPVAMTGESGTLSIVMYDVMGKAKWSRELNLTQNYQELEFTYDELKLNTNGTYILKFELQAGEVSRTFNKRIAFFR